MTDKSPEGRLGFPFTRDEYLSALSVLMAREDAESAVRAIYDDPEAIGLSVQDLDLLLLASLSEDAAARVVGYRPRLEPDVRLVRQDPEGFRSQVRPAN